MSIGAYIDCDRCSETPTATSAKGDFRRRLREEIAREGWVRQKIDGKMLDLCASCADHAARGAAPTGD